MDDVIAAIQTFSSNRYVSLHQILRHLRDTQGLNRLDLAEAQIVIEDLIRQGKLVSLAKGDLSTLWQYTWFE